MPQRRSPAVGGSGLPTIVSTQSWPSERSNWVSTLSYSMEPPTLGLTSTISHAHRSSTRSSTW
jgi:hypothetical protein